jgi:hypothetical protein
MNILLETKLIENSFSLTLVLLLLVYRSLYGERGVAGKQSSIVL